MSETAPARRGPQPDYSRTNGAGRALANAIGDRAQSDVAAELEISAAFLNHLIRGRKVPGRRLAVKIRDQLGVPPEAWDG